MGNAGRVGQMGEKVSFYFKNCSEILMQKFLINSNDINVDDDDNDVNDCK